MNIGHKFEDLAGQKFGLLTVLDDEPYFEDNAHMYLCLCECGNMKYLNKYDFKRGKVKSCGHLLDESNHRLGVRGNQIKVIDLTNQRFGKLIVISYAERDYLQRCRWLCKCDCGKEKIVDSGNLRSGHTTSCGCSTIEAVLQRHKNTRILKGLDENTLICREERLQFSESGLIEETLKRDKYKCQCCYQKGGNLEVHHIYHWSTHLELRYDKKNLITLCKKCHKDIIHNGNYCDPADEKTIKFLTDKIERIYISKGLN
jgi:hypothetical protein